MTQGGHGMSSGQTRFRLVRISPDVSVAILHQRLPDGTLWGSNGRRILRKESESSWHEVVRLPFVWQRDLLAFLRPAARALRADKANVYVNTSSRAFAIRSSVVYSLPEAMDPVPLFRIQGDSVLHGGMCEDLQGWSYIGEYFMNPAREAVRIWRVDPGLENWQIAHTFAAGTVRHVHGIYRDPFDEQALWVTTGDQEGECFFFRTRNRFQSLEQIGGGGQAWRAVRLFFTPEHVCWLTDSQLETNYAFRMERSSGRIEQGASLAAPAWYGTHTSDDAYVAFTTVEPGPAVQRTSAAVLVSEDAFHWEEVHQFEKDFWRPMKVFKYGVISCPAGSMDLREVLISGEGLRGLDASSAKLEIERVPG
jgi:hypothetical protein